MKCSTTELRQLTETPAASASANLVHSGTYGGDLRMPDALDADEIRVRVVARDLARNRVEQDVRVPVLSDLCCEDEETCGLMVPAASGDLGPGSAQVAGLR